MRGSFRSSTRAHPLRRAVRIETSRWCWPPGAKFRLKTIGLIREFPVAPRGAHSGSVHDAHAEAYSMVRAACGAQRSPRSLVAGQRIELNEATGNGVGPADERRHFLVLTKRYHVPL